MDKSNGIDPKTSLDQALSQQMQVLVVKKRDALKERVNFKAKICSFLSKIYLPFIVETKRA